MRTKAQIKQEPLQCEICDKSFNSKPGLEQHIQNELSVKVGSQLATDEANNQFKLLQIICHICDKVFTTKAI